MGTFVKATNNYNAKLAIWAEENRPRPLPEGLVPPLAHSIRFDSYDAFNKWKQKRILSLAESRTPWKRKSDPLRRRTFAIC